MTFFLSSVFQGRVWTLDSGGVGDQRMSQIRSGASAELRPGSLEVNGVEEGSWRLALT